ncbi:hypothetical protein [Streptomyces tendae]|uniref:hypothetical protein n=1 Tax=Streptomyces tendae TaxID=1932 RepID=UPI0036B93B8F
MNDIDRYAELPIAEQIAEAETRLARLELELARSGGAQRDHRAVEGAEQHLGDLKARAARLERLERAEARKREAAAGAVKAHADAEKKHAADLKKERAALVASRGKAESAVKAAGEAVTAALEALREHSEAVEGAAGRLEALGLLLVDEHGNRFEQGGRRPGVGAAAVSLGGDGFGATYLADRERRVNDVVRRAVEGSRPVTPSLGRLLREARGEAA